MQKYSKAISQSNRKPRNMSKSTRLLFKKYYNKQIREVENPMILRYLKYSRAKYIKANKLRAGDSITTDKGRIVKIESISVNRPINEVFKCSILFFLEGEELPRNLAGINNFIKYN